MTSELENIAKEKLKTYAMEYEKMLMLFKKHAKDDVSIENRNIPVMRCHDFMNALKECEGSQATTVNSKLPIADVIGSASFTTEEVKDLKKIRNYFGEHDKTLFEHWAYSCLDDVLKRIHTNR